jgi:hypothetical protein
LLKLVFAIIAIGPYGNRTPRYTIYNHVRQSSSYFGVIPIKFY